MYGVCMKARFLLLACLSLIAGSVFLAPETAWLGASPGTIVDLSRALLLLGMTAAVLAIQAEARKAS